MYIEQDNTQDNTDSINKGRIGIVIGIASWSGACATPIWPDVYARVTNALKWIEALTGKYRVYLYQRFSC